MKRLESFLETFDYFSSKTLHNLRFHGQYLKAREVFYENSVIFPDLVNKPASSDSADDG